MTRVFVYGTLKRDHGNHRLLEGSKYLGTAISAPEFVMLHLGGFPGIVRGGETTIKGELYEVDAETLRRLDALEGHPSFYERQPINVTLTKSAGVPLADGTTLEDGSAPAAEGYVLPRTWLGQRGVIESGVWGRSSVGGR